MTHRGTDALRYALLWHRPRAFRWSLLATALIVAASFLVSRAAWSADGATLIDGHAIVSLDLATARAFCGAGSAYSRTTGLAPALSAQMELRTVPLRELIATKAGSLAAYCQAIDQPFVNNENSLGLLESSLLKAWPGLSLSQLGQAMHLLRIAGLSLFVLLLIDLGASLALGFATMLCGLMVLTSMPDFLYSSYPFLFILVLVVASLHGFAVKYCWTAATTGLVAYGVLAGALSAFTSNLRSSYLPIVAAFFVFVVMDELRRGDSRVRTVRASALLACFAAGFIAFQYGLITRHLPDEGRFNASHPFGHPLVLALAVPENDFSRAQGIRWADEVGPQISARIDPSAPFLSPGYNAALLQYYRGLWREHPRQMLGVYYLKFSVAGADMIQVLRSSPGSVGAGVKLLLTPLSWLPSGVWLLGLYVIVGLAAAAAYLRYGHPAGFVLALLTLAACLLQAEAGAIFSTFTKQYHNYSAFYALFGSLLGLQAAANVAAARWLPAEDAIGT